jgi:hypothetical protein
VAVGVKVDRMLLTVDGWVEIADPVSAQQVNKNKPPATISASKGLIIIISKFFPTLLFNAFHVYRCWLVRLDLALSPHWPMFFSLSSSELTKRVPVELSLGAGVVWKLKGHLAEFEPNP